LALLPEKARRQEYGTRAARHSSRPAARGKTASYWKKLTLVASRVRLSVAGYDGGLDLAPTVQHLLQDLFQFGERRLAGHVIVALDFLLGNQSEGAAHRLRRVMERGLQGELRIMHAVGVKLHFGAGGAAAEEVDHAAAAHHVHRPLPGLRATNG